MKQNSLKKIMHNYSDMHRRTKVKYIVSAWGCLCIGYAQTQYCHIMIPIQICLSSDAYIHLALEYNTPALAPSIRMRSTTSGQPSPPEGRSVNLAQHISTSPAASLMGAVGGINEIVASASNSNQIWKKYQHLTYKVPHVHHNHKANILLVYNYHVHSYVCQLESFGKHSAMFCIQYSFSYDCS